MMRDYTILSKQTGPHVHLKRIVERHQETLFSPPISGHQQAAFETAQQWLDAQNRPLILDAGCGTGQSTASLSEQYPDHAILGIDKSLARLERHAEGASQNYFLLRANLVDFCLLALRAGRQFDHLFLFYPNPWPKPKHFQRRWHGHPIFPSLLKLAKRIEVRTNWKIYLEEFSLACKLCDQRKITFSNFETDRPISKFEEKYLATQTELFRLVLAA